MYYIIPHLFSLAVAPPAGERVLKSQYEIMGAHIVSTFGQWQQCAYPALSRCSCTFLSNGFRQTHSPILHTHLHTHLMHTFTHFTHDCLAPRIFVFGNNCAQFRFSNFFYMPLLYWILLLLLLQLQLLQLQLQLCVPLTAFQIFPTFAHWHPSFASRSHCPRQQQRQLIMDM